MILMAKFLRCLLTSLGGMELEDTSWRVLKSHTNPEEEGKWKMTVRTPKLALRSLHVAANTSRVCDSLASGSTCWFTSLSLGSPDLADVSLQ